MAPTDADRILAPGVPVTLQDREYRLIFDFEALAIAEGGAGGLQAFLNRLRDKSWRVRMVRLGMVAALSHYELSEKDVVGMLDFRKLGPYADALLEAFDQAMPPAKPRSKVPRATGGSRGSSSTELPSGSDSGTSAV